MYYVIIKIKKNGTWTTEVSEDNISASPVDHYTCSERVQKELTLPVANLVQDTVVPKMGLVFESSKKMSSRLGGGLIRVLIDISPHNHGFGGCHCEYLYRTYRTSSSSSFCLFLLRNKSLEGRLYVTLQLAPYDRHWLASKHQLGLYCRGGDALLKYVRLIWPWGCCKWNTEGRGTDG